MLPGATAAAAVQGTSGMVGFGLSLQSREKCFVKNKQFFWVPKVFEPESDSMSHKAFATLTTKIIHLQVNEAARLIVIHWQVREREVEL